jgi:signal transduction histidine kinase
VCCAPPTSAQDVADFQKKRVVVLYSMPLDFPATQMTEQGIRQVFDSHPGMQVQLFSEYLDLSRFRGAGQRHALADLLQQRYGNGRTDLIICVDVPAATFMLDHGESISPGIPLVMCSLPEFFKPRVLESPLRDRVFGVVEPEETLRRLVDSAFALRPQTRHMVLVAGVFANDEARSAPLRRLLHNKTYRAELIDLSGLPLEEVLDRCNKLPPDSIIFFSTFFMDPRDLNFVPRDVVQLIGAHSTSPVFGPYTSYMGSGIVGGPLISLERQGAKAAELAVRVLEGRASRKNPFENGQDTTEILYDWRQIERHGINRHLLLGNSTILYKEANLWDEYRWYIIGAIVLLVVQSLLILGLIVNLNRRKRAEQALLASQEELQTLAGRLIHSQEEELRRLSREFHDDVTQRLAAVAIEAGTLEMQPNAMEGRVRESIAKIREQLIGLAEDVHAISREMHPAILKDLGLQRALISLCVHSSDRNEFHITPRFTDIPEEIPPETALCLYRVVQEALRNITKHARARHVDIRLTGADDRLLLTIEDDGVGFDPRCARRTPGLGLASMRERVQYVKGGFAVHSEPGQGTVIDVWVPCPPQEAL